MGKVEKLENPVRLLELAPRDTLIKIGIKSDDKVCDLGAGSGIFTIPAATITDNIVAAFETDPEMLDVIRKKASSQGLKNIETVQVGGETIDAPDSSFTLALMVTVLHELSGKEAYIKELRRVLSASGRAAVIEFNNEDTEKGPPLDLRIGKNELESLMSSAGFKTVMDFDMGKNLYCMVFSPVQ